MGKTLFLILAVLTLASPAQKLNIIDWHVSECLGSHYELPYEFAVEKLLSNNKTSKFTFKFVENCALEADFELTLKSNEIHITLINKVPVAEMTFCDCVFAADFTIKGKIQKDAKFYHNNKELINLSDPHPYKTIYKVVNGDTIDRFNDQGKRQGLWDMDGEIHHYSNGQLVNYTRNYKNGNFYYQNLLESFYVIKSDTFDLIDKQGKKQGIHIGAQNFVEQNPDDFHIDSIAFYKNGMRIFGYEPFQQKFNGCEVVYEKIDFYDSTKISTSNPQHDDDYMYDGEGSFVLINPKKSNLKLSTDPLKIGQSLQISPKNMFYDFDFYKIVVVGQDGKSIRLMDHSMDRYHSEVQLVGIDTNSVKKQMVIHTNIPSYKFVYKNDPRKMKNKDYEVFEHVFKRAGVYEIRYYREPCRYERAKIYYQE